MNKLDLKLYKAIENILDHLNSSGISYDKDFLIESYYYQFFQENKIIGEK